MKKVSDIFDRGILTNQGPNVQEFEQTMRKFLGVEHFHYVTNGTIALQLALRALGITEGEVITTPFSYVATVSSILWERCTPVFVDIEPDNFTIDVTKIEEAITPRTKAIMPVHVFGYACDVDAIESIAKKHDLKVIYDAAHTFGSFYKGRALCSYGDISTLSFHATKLFHTIEGGGIVVSNDDLSRRVDLVKRFGHEGDLHFMLGINAKQDEFNAAMGIVNFRYLEKIISLRKEICKLYDELLDGKLGRPKSQKFLEYNYAYYPILFKSESQLIAILNSLSKLMVFPRRYFYPSLNNLPYIKGEKCPVSEDISSRIICLPLYVGLEKSDVEFIAKNILMNIGK